MAATKTAAKKADAKESKPKKTTAKKSEPKAKSAAKNQPKPKSDTKESKPKKSSSQKTYSDPEMREKLKEEIKAGDKGGKSGQWSARKAQLLAHEYEAKGGTYTGPKTEKQKHLSEWTDEKWTTKDGKKADKGDETARYLPEKAWDEMSEKEKNETDTKKRTGSKKGKQNVANTDAAKSAKKKAKA